MKWNTKIIRPEKGKRSIDETISYHFKIETNGQIYHHSSITSDQDCWPNIVSLAFALVVSVMCFFLSTIKINLMRFNREVVDKTHEENQIVAKERRRQKKKEKKKLEKLKTTCEIKWKHRWVQWLLVAVTQLKYIIDCNMQTLTTIMHVCFLEYSVHTGRLRANTIFNRKFLTIFNFKKKIVFIIESFWLIGFP